MNDVLKFIDAAAHVTGLDPEHIRNPTRKLRMDLPSAQYYLHCRLRWLACIYAEENGMTKGEIIRANNFNGNVPYYAWGALPAIKADKSLCRILRDIMGHLAAMDGRTA